MKSFKCAQRLSISMLIVLAAFVTLSCSGLFLTKNAKSEMGTITIALPESGVRRGYSSEDVEYYKVSVISEKDGTAVVPSQRVDVAVFSEALPVGNYSVIVQGMINANSDMPLFYGRTNNVTVTAGETTTATIVMREFHTETSTYSGNMEMLNPDWGSGKLPSFKLDYYDFEGWYTDAECTQAITEYPATDSEDFTYPFAKLVRKPVFYATQDGDGNKKGLNAENPMKLAEAFTELAQFSHESKKVPTLVLLDDVQLDGSQIVWSVNIIGAKNGVDNEPVTVTGARNDCVVPFNAGASYTIKNLIIANGEAATGIKNAGNLTFENCEFNAAAKTRAIENTGSLSLINCQISSTGAQGIKNAGSLKMTDCSISNCGTATTLGGGIYTTQPITLINTSITGCNGSYGQMIYCAKEEGSNPTVNGIGAEFEGDFYFDGEIPDSTQYDASTFPASASQPGVFYATQNGAGERDGRNIDNAIPINTALNPISSNPVYAYASQGEIPTLYVSGDIELSTNYTQQKGVNIIGVLGSGSGEDGRPKVISKGTIADYSGIFIFDKEAIYTLENFHIVGTGDWIGISITSTQPQITIKNCYFYDCDKCGVYTNARKTVIEDCIFYDCNSSRNGTVTLNSDGINVEISRCQFINCSGSYTGGIYYRVSSDNTTTSLKIKDCTFTNCVGNGFSYGGPTYKGHALFLGGPTTIEGLTITDCLETEPSIYVFCEIITSAGTSYGYPVINEVKVTKNKWINGDVSPDSDLSKDSSLWLTN